MRDSTYNVTTPMGLLALTPAHQHARRFAAYFLVRQEAQSHLFCVWPKMLENVNLDNTSRIFGSHSLAERLWYETLVKHSNKSLRSLSPNSKLCLFTCKFVYHKKYNTAE